EFIFLAYSHLHNSHRTRVIFSEALTRRHSCSVWIPETGEKKRVHLDPDGGLALDLGPADSLLFAFDRERADEQWLSVPVTGIDVMMLDSGWTAEFRHCHDGSVREAEIGRLTDL